MGGAFHVKSQGLNHPFKALEAPISRRQHATIGAEPLQRGGGAPEGRASAEVIHASSRLRPCWRVTSRRSTPRYARKYTTARCSSEVVSASATLQGGAGRESAGAAGKHVVWEEREELCVWGTCVKHAPSGDRCVCVQGGGTSGGRHTCSAPPGSNRRRLACPGCAGMRPPPAGAGGQEGAGREGGRAGKRGAAAIEGGTHGNRGPCTVLH